MNSEQVMIVGVLVCTLALFVWDRWRFDVVAVTSLMACVVTGLVEPKAAFSGFSDAAVITVAAVLAISRALAKSGVVDLAAGKLTQISKSQFGHLVSLCLFGAFLSAFMNNVGALALVMPVALSTARSFGYSPSAILMPLSFSTLLGGMITLIGTPPNLLISDFRAQAVGERFHMFDFAPTGLALATAGIAFIVVIGWRLIPRDRKGKPSDEEMFEVSHYVTEARVRDNAKSIALSVPQFEDRFDDAVLVIGIIRKERRLWGRLRFESIRPGDILLLQTDSATLQRIVKEEGLELVEKAPVEGVAGKSAPIILEAVVTPNSWIQERSSASLNLRERWGINLLAVSRQGRPITARLRDVRFHAGDVLLIEGDENLVNEAVTSLGCLPLANRKLLFEPRRLTLPILLFATAILITAFGIMPAAVAFTCTVLALILVKSLRPMEVYEAIDWPVIILLGAMIPVGGALESTGTARLIAEGVAALAGHLDPVIILGMLLGATMAITPLLNNAATVVIMAPIAIGIAHQLEVSPDPLLMGVAIGASCDFLTPFGHQNNTIILGPGGYRFADFWRLGSPLEAIVIIVSLLVIPAVWPFRG